MELSEKQNSFSEFVSAFLKYILNFEKFQKKDDRHNWCILQITHSEKRG